MKKKSKLPKGFIDHSDIMECWGCNATGRKPIKVLGYNFTKKCDLCSGTGKYRESHYYIVDEKNKIAFDSDTFS